MSQQGSSDASAQAVDCSPTSSTVADCNWGVLRQGDDSGETGFSPPFHTNASVLTVTTDGQPRDQGGGTAGGEDQEQASAQEELEAPRPPGHQGAAGFAVPEECVFPPHGDHTVSPMGLPSTFAHQNLPTGQPSADHGGSAMVPEYNHPLLIARPMHSGEAVVPAGTGQRQPEQCYGARQRHPQTAPIPPQVEVQQVTRTMEAMALDPGNQLQYPPGAVPHPGVGLQQGVFLPPEHHGSVGEYMDTERGRLSWRVSPQTPHSLPGPLMEQHFLPIRGARSLDGQTVVPILPQGDLNDVQDLGSDTTSRPPSVQMHGHQAQGSPLQFGPGHAFSPIPYPSLAQQGAVLTQQFQSQARENTHREVERVFSPGAGNAEHVHRHGAHDTWIRQEEAEMNALQQRLAQEQQQLQQQRRMVARAPVFPPMSLAQPRLRPPLPPMAQTVTMPNIRPTLAPPRPAGPLLVSPVFRPTVPTSWGVTPGPMGPGYAAISNAGPRFCPPTPGHGPPPAPPAYGHRPPSVRPAYGHGPTHVPPTYGHAPPPVGWPPPPATGRVSVGAMSRPDRLLQDLQQAVDQLQNLPLNARVKQINARMKTAEEKARRLTRMQDEQGSALPEAMVERCHAVQELYEQAYEAAAVLLDDQDDKAQQERASLAAMPKHTLQKLEMTDTDADFTIQWTAAKKQIQGLLQRYNGPSTDDALWSAFNQMLPVQLQKQISYLRVTDGARDAVMKSVRLFDERFGDLKIVIPRLEEQLKAVAIASGHRQVQSHCSTYMAILDQLKTLNATASGTTYVLRRDLANHVFATINKAARLDNHKFVDMDDCHEDYLFDHVYALLKETHALFGRMNRALNIGSEKKKDPPQTNSFVAQSQGQEGGVQPPALVPGSAAAAGTTTTPVPKKARKRCNYCLLVRKVGVNDVNHPTYLCSHIGPATNRDELQTAEICLKCLEQAPKAAKAHTCPPLKNKKGEAWSPLCGTCQVHKRLCTHGVRPVPAATGTSCLTTAETGDPPAKETSLALVTTKKVIPRLRGEPEDAIFIREDIGLAKLLFGKVRLAYAADDGSTQFVSVDGMFDLGSQNSHVSVSLKPYAAMETVSDFTVSSDGGQRAHEEGKVYVLKPVTDEGRWFNTQALERPNMENQEVYSSKIRWLSVPEKLADKYDLKKKSGYLATIKNNVIIAEQTTQAKIVVGISWDSLRPVELERYVDHHGSITIWKNQFSSERMLSGGRLTLSLAEMRRLNQTLPIHLQWSVQEYSSFLNTTTTMMGRPSSSAPLEVSPVEDLFTPSPDSDNSRFQYMPAKSLLLASSVAKTEVRPQVLPWVEEDDCGEDRDAANAHYLQHSRRKSTALCASRTAMAAALLEPEEGSGDPVEEGTLPPADDYEQHRQEEEVGEQGVAMEDQGGPMLNHQRALSTLSQGDTATTVPDNVQCQDINAACVQIYDPQQDLNTRLPITPKGKKSLYPEQELRGRISYRPEVKKHLLRQGIPDDFEPVKHALHRNCKRCLSCVTCALDLRGLSFRLREYAAFYRSRLTLTKSTTAQGFAFTVDYVFITNILKKLPPNLDICKQRLVSFEKALNRLPAEAATDFVESLNVGEKRGYWEEVDFRSLPGLVNKDVHTVEQLTDEHFQKGSICVSPMNIVLKETPSSTTARVILDPTVKSYSGAPSLNEALSSPVNLQRPLGDILLSSREGAAAILADVSRMFYHLLLSKESQNKCLFIARRDPQTGKISVGNSAHPMALFRSLGSIMGITQTPMYASLSIESVASWVEAGGDRDAGPVFEADPQLAGRLQAQSYVDDLQSYLLLQEVKKLLEQGGIHAVVAHLANAAAKVEIVLQSRCLSTKGWSIISTFTQGFDQEKFDQLVKQRMQMIHAGVSPLPKTLSQEWKQAFPVGSCYHTDADNFQALPQNGKVANLEVEEPLDGDPFAVQLPNSSAILGVRVSAEDWLVLGKTSYLNLAKPRRNQRPKTGRCYSLEQFKEYIKLHPLRIRDLLSITASHFDPVRIAEPLRFFGAVTYRKAVLQAKGFEPFDKEALTQADVRRKIKKGVKPGTDKLEAKQIMKQHYDRLVDERHLPDVFAFVTNLLEVRGRKLTRRFTGPPAHLRDVVNRLLLVPDAASGLFAGAGCTAYHHFEGTTVEGALLSGANLITSCSHLNPSTRLICQVSSELTAGGLAVDLGRQVLQNFTSNFDEVVLMQDSVTALQLYLSMSIIFDLKVALIIDKVQKFISPSSLYWVPGTTVDRLTDKITKPYSNSNELMNGDWFHGGPLAKPFAQIEKKSALLLEKIDHRKLPFLNSRKEIMNLQHSSLQMGGPRTAAASFKTELGISRLCATQCGVCGSRPLTTLEKALTEVGEASLYDEGEEWPGNPNAKVLALMKSYDKQTQQVTNTASLRSAAAGAAAPGLASQVSGPQSYEVNCAIPPRLPASLIPRTTLFAMLGNAPPALVRKRPGNQLPLPRNTHKLHGNPFSSLFRRVHCVFKAARVLARCLEWIHKHRREKMPALYVRLRFVLLRMFQLECRDALTCLARTTRGAQSSHNYVTHNQILWRQSRPLELPLRMSADHDLITKLDTEKENKQDDTFFDRTFNVPVLCGETEFAKALMRSIHDIKHCQSPEITRVELQRQAVVLHGYPYLKKLRKACFQCRILAPRPLVCPLAPFPLDHPTLAPGDWLQFDVLGPMMVLASQRQRATRKTTSANLQFKCWILVGKDQMSRMCYATLIEGLSAEAFLAGFQAISAAAGSPKVQASLDLGSNITGAQKHLRLTTTEQGQERLVSEDQIDDHPTLEMLTTVVDTLQKAGHSVHIHQAPAKAPWRIGGAESLVKAVKHTMLRSFHYRTKLTVIQLSHLLDRVMYMVNQRPLSVIHTDTSTRLLTPNALSGKCFGRLLELPTSYNDVSEVHKRQVEAMKRFRQHWLKLTLPTYTRLMATQRFTGRAHLPQVDAVVLLFDKKSASGHPALARVTKVNQEKKLLDLVYSTPQGHKEVTQRAFESVALISNPTDRHVVDIDPFDQQLQGQVECACMGTRPCPLQNACLLKAAEKLQTEDAMGEEADSQVEVDPQELPQGGSGSAVSFDRTMPDNELQGTEQGDASKGGPVTKAMKRNLQGQANSRITYGSPHCPPPPPTTSPPLPATAPTSSSSTDRSSSTAAAPPPATPPPLPAATPASSSSDRSPSAAAVTPHHLFGALVRSSAISNKDFGGINIVEKLKQEEKNRQK